MVNQRLQIHNQQHIEYYLTEIGRKENVADFQFYQTIDALSILFCVEPPSLYKPTHFN